MASITFSPLPPPATAPLNVGAIAAPAALAFVAAEAGAPALPAASLVPALPEPPAEAAADGAAMRPDQVFMSRQLAWPVADGATLASSWRALVHAYGAQLAVRERQAQGGQLSAAVLMVAQEARVLRQPDSPGQAPDPWRFTVHTGGPREQHLSVTSDEPEQQPGRRRRARAALRLELVLEDGALVSIQAEPLPGGLVLELCALDAGQLERLRALQPELEAAVGRAGLRVLRWRYHAGTPGGRAHARVASAHVASILTLPVFRALAELALQLPLQGT